MKTKQTIRHLAIAAALAALPSFAHAQDAGPIKELNTFYFGNSFLENTMVGFHSALGESAGKDWETNALIHPGVPIWVHAVRQDDPTSVNYKKFAKEGAETDAIVMLQFAGMGLEYVTPDMWDKEFFDPPRDVGDVASCATIIRRYLAMNPKGRAYVYTAWPNSDKLGDFRDRVKKVQASLENKNSDRGAVMKKVVDQAAKERISEEIEPILEQTDFAELWLAEDYIAECTPYEVRQRFGKYAGYVRRAGDDITLEGLAEAAGTTPDQAKADLAMVNLTIEKVREAGDPIDLVGQFANAWPNTFSRPHNYALLEALKKEFPDMWAEDRLGMIPVGDVMLALDEKIKAGALPPLKSVAQFSEGHMRSGLPRYMLGATFYAVLFKDHPKNLSADIYADRANYINQAKVDAGGLNTINGHYVHIPDLGKHIEITPERKKLVDDTIWEVVSTHPYTLVK